VRKTSRHQHAVGQALSGLPRGRHKVRSTAVGVLASLLLTMCASGAFAQSARQPRRIVSTSPSITETLFALGLGSRVVGVSSYCRYPVEVEKLPRVGSFLKPDAEAIAHLQPDLVIVHAGPHTVPQQLASLGIRVTTVERGTLAGVYSSIRAIGVAADVPDRSEALVATIQRRLEAARSAARSHPKRRVLLVVGRQPGTLTDLIAVGPGSFLHDLIGAAGGVNVLGDPKLPEYPHVSMETVIRLAPDVIVDAGDMGDTVDEHRRRQPATERLWRRQINVKAARDGDVHAVTSDAFVVPGPRVVEAVETLARWLDAAGGGAP
jgi:iron complex transport system substrate-binding protein